MKGPPEEPSEAGDGEASSEHTQAVRALELCKEEEEEDQTKEGRPRRHLLPRCEEDYALSYNTVVSEHEQPKIPNLWQHYWGRGALFELCPDDSYL